MSPLWVVGKQPQKLPLRFASLSLKIRLQCNSLSFFSLLFKSTTTTSAPGQPDSYSSGRVTSSGALVCVVFDFIINISITGIYLFRQAASRNPAPKRPSDLNRQAPAVPKRFIYLYSRLLVHLFFILFIWTSLLEQSVPQQQQTYAQQPASIFSGTSIMPKLQHPQHKTNVSIDKGPISDIIVRNQSRNNMNQFRAVHQTALKQFQILQVWYPLHVFLVSIISSDVTPSEHFNNYMAKVEQCCHICDMSPDAPPAAVLDRETKTRYLKDIVTYITTAKNVFPETAWNMILKMISVNIFRPLPITEKPPTLRLPVLFYFLSCLFLFIFYYSFSSSSYSYYYYYY